MPLCQPRTIHPEPLVRLMLKSWTCPRTPRAVPAHIEILRQELNRRRPHRKTASTLVSLTAIKLLHANREGKGAA